MTPEKQSWVGQARSRARQGATRLRTDQTMHWICLHTMTLTKLISTVTLTKTGKDKGQSSGTQPHLCHPNLLPWDPFCYELNVPLYPVTLPHSK